MPLNDEINSRMGGSTLTVTDAHAHHLCPPLSAFEKMTDAELSRITLGTATPDDLVSESRERRINYQNLEVVRFEWQIDGVMDNKQDAKLVALCDSKTSKGLLRHYATATNWRPRIEGRMQMDISFECLVADEEKAADAVREVLGIRQEELEKMEV